jgi:crotonobetainyl-CoA:carnitine CoA-transferase CaiB-like acyl-CoA transferase
MDGPLAGIRVLDLTRVLAGPFATMLLADLGADVIKVERPGDGDETRHIVAMQALGGHMSLTGEPGGPPMRSGLPMADLGTGLFAAVGLLAAVVEKQRTGRGQLVDVAMFDAMAGLLTQYAGRYFMTGESVQRVGNGHPGVAPYGTYEAKDGDIVIANLGERFWPKIARAIGRPELTGDERFRTNHRRVVHRRELDELINAETRKRTVAEWEAAFETYDVPHAPVLTVQQVLEHPQAKARGLVTEVDHPNLGRTRVTGRPVNLPAHPQAGLRPAPLLGEHTEQVLTELLGCSAERIRELRQAGVLG